MKRFGLLTALLIGAVACQDQTPVEPSQQTGDQQLRGDATPMNHSHGRFFHINWIPRPDLSPTTVEFTYQAAFRRNSYTTCRQFSGGTWSNTPCTGPGGVAGPGDIVLETVGGTNFVFGDGTSTPTLHFLVTSIDIPNNWLFSVAVDPATGTPNLVKEYPGAGPYTASSFTCCRIGGLRNPGSTYGAATIVNLDLGNRSPIATTVPIVNVVRGGVRTWAIPANDPDGDPLRFMLTPIGDWPINGSQPADMSINPTSGVVSWSTDGKPLGLWWSNVTVEELNPDGSRKGLVQVDYLINLVAQAPDNNPPLFTAPAFCGGSVTVAPGNALSFPLQAQDPDAGDVVSLAASGLPPGASFNAGTPGNPVNGSFTWTPTGGQQGTYIVTFSATDQDGAQALCSITVVVSVTPPPCTQVTLASVYGTGLAPGTVSLSQPDVFVEVLNVEGFLPRPAGPEHVRLGASWPTGTASTHLSVADLNNDGDRDIRIRFATSQLVNGGNLSAQTQTVWVWGSDPVTGDLFCGTTNVTVVP